MGNSGSRIATLPAVVDRQVQNTSSPIRPIVTILDTPRSSLPTQCETEPSVRVLSQKRPMVSPYSTKIHDTATTGRPLQRLLTMSMTDIRGSLKRKVTEVGDIAADPRPTKRSLSLVSMDHLRHCIALRSSSNLLGGPQLNHATTTFIFTLPQEMLIAITTLLSGRDLLHTSQACRLFAFIAGPIYMAECGLVLPPTEDSLFILRGRAYDALMVWNCVSTSPPHKLWFCSFDMEEPVARRQMRQLQAFWDQPLMECESVYFSYFNLDSVPSELLALLRALSQTGCARLECHGLSEASPSLAGFKNATVDSEPQFSLRSWAQLLPHASLPHLHTLEIESSCRITTLLKFLQRHPTVEHLDIKPSRLHHSQSAGHCNLSSINLSELTSLSGPPSYVSAILQHLNSPPALSRLTLLFSDITPPYRLMTAIKQNLTKCRLVYALDVTLPQRALLASHFMVAKNELSLPHISSLSIVVPNQCCIVSNNVDEHSDNVFILLIPWLYLFPNIKSLTLEEHRYRDHITLLTKLRTINPAMRVTIKSGGVTLSDVPVA
ncbi:hypothetical protein BJ138DRAFT_1118950 [Hygrophoropsis aurantiaca]|uniref:Uncharacterized protein n=1 Tax=Hygrophoropsis aurantiaca TaxID=72124 RepID=A0ACB7ZV34_9AGAM|nr:hypothetical protein BJ138DRAFT_1118950 [Hygrophoropsis aurantiaca]